MVLFLSNRGKSGLTQLFQLNLPDDVSATSSYPKITQITDYPLSINTLLIDRRGTHVAFSCQVYANLSIEETAARQAAEKESGSLVYKFDKLFIRQWDEYILGLRYHPFVAQIKKNSNGIYQIVDKPRDVLFGIDSDSPIRQSGGDGMHWSFSASGKKFAFVRRYDETSQVAWTNNFDIFTIDLTVPDAKPICITEGNLASDVSPIYSPIDDNVLLYGAQSVHGYDSDLVKMKLYNGKDNSFQMRFDLIFSFVQVLIRSTFSMVGILKLRRSHGHKIINHCFSKYKNKDERLFIKFQTSSLQHQLSIVSLSLVHLKM